MSGYTNDNNPSSLGGGNMRSINRFVMRDAMGKPSPIANKAGIPLQTLNSETSLTPFRAAYNAGDLRSAVDSAPAPGMWNSNQLSGVGNIRSLMFGLGDGTRSNGSALFSGNPKYVYDSSDYIRFKKLSSERKNYTTSLNTPLPTVPPPP